MMEKVQCRAAKILLPLQDKSYEERLSVTVVSLPSLCHIDLILLYKILNNHFNSDFTDLER